MGQTQTRVVRWFVAHLHGRRRERHSEQTKRYISLDKILDLKGLRKKYPPYTMEKVELGTERPLHVTFATVELVTLVDNWLTYSVRANIKKIVVVSLDEALHTWCEKEVEKRRTHRRESGGEDDDDNDDVCVPGGHLLDKLGIPYPGLSRSEGILLRVDEREDTNHRNFLVEWIRLVDLRCGRHVGARSDAVF